MVLSLIGLFDYNVQGQLGGLGVAQRRLPSHDLRGLNLRKIQALMFRGRGPLPLVKTGTAVLRLSLALRRFFLRCL